MTTTMGQLVASIFQAYERELGDEHIAAVATQVRLCDLLGKRVSEPAANHGNALRRLREGVGS